MKHEAALGEPHPIEIAEIATRCQNDDRSVVAACERRGDLEPVEVGEVHVEQDDVRGQRSRGGDPRAAVLRLGDHLIAVRFEHASRAAAKAWIVIDDQRVLAMPWIVAPRPLHTVRLPASGG